SQTGRGQALRVIPNAVDMRAFGSRPIETQIDERQRGGFVYAAMGNLVASKGFDVLLHAFRLVCDVKPDSTLVIAGAGPQRQALRQLATELGIQGRVTFAGELARAEAPRFFGGCDCFVCSSLYETFGMVLIEALACGKPVVSTRCGGPQDIVTEQNGILCDPGSVPELAQAMLALRRHGYYSSQTIRSGCAARFSADAVCGQLEALYGDVLQGRATV
ncbi:MAG: glycosyltransferase, partial [Clostridia bacterium]|nr:glycosyltransferase [Clostridia bacterium]